MQAYKIFISLGRFFGAPIVIFSVLLGVAMGGHWSWISAVITLAGVLEMAYAHTFNAFLDYAWTGLDRGGEAERSRGKVYTHGQQLIAAGVLTSGQVAFYGIAYLVFSSVLVAVVATQTTPWVWLIWGLSVPLTFVYSWGKLHWLCETILGLGFGPFAVMLGMATQPHPDYGRAFLAGIPMAILFGFAAECLDQWTDAAPNWPRGLRNLGALVWHSRTSITLVVGWLMVATFVSQLFLIQCGVLKPTTMLTLLAMVPLTLCLILLEKKDDSEQTDSKAGIIWGLAGIYLYGLLLFLGQVLS